MRILLNPILLDPSGRDHLRYSHFPAATACIDFDAMFSGDEFVHRPAIQEAIDHAKLDRVAQAWIDRAKHIDVPAFDADLAKINPAFDAAEKEAFITLVKTQGDVGAVEGFLQSHLTALRGESKRQEWLLASLDKQWDSVKRYNVKKLQASHLSPEGKSSCVDKLRGHPVSAADEDIPVDKTVITKCKALYDSMAKDPEMRDHCRVFAHDKPTIVLSSAVDVLGHMNRNSGILLLYSNLFDLDRARQRYSKSSLKDGIERHIFEEEMRHYVDADIGFSRRPEWEEAAHKQFGNYDKVSAYSAKYLVGTDKKGAGAEGSYVPEHIPIEVLADALAVRSDIRRREVEVPKWRRFVSGGRRGNKGDEALKKIFSPEICDLLTRYDEAVLARVQQIGHGR